MEQEFCEEQHHRADHHPHHHEKDDHDHDVTIIVNARSKEVERGTLTFNRVVELAFGTFDPNPNVTYDVTWSLHKDHGSLVYGQTLEARKGLVINVTRSDKS